MADQYIGGTVVFKRLGLVALAAYVLCAAHIHADTLSRDATFASNGLFKTEIGPHTDSFKGAYGMALQTDGKVVLAGVCNGAAESDFCLVRLTAAGQFDTTFNGTGSVISPVATVGAYGRAVAVQADGKIVVAGACADVEFDQLCVVRYTAAGALDTSFNSTGRAVTTFASSGAETSVANAVAIQSDQKIVAGGVCNVGGSLMFCIARYNSDGSLDQSFNASAPPDGRGMRVTAVTTTGSSTANAILVQPDQKIVQVGACNSAASSGIRMCALRLNPDGSLDSTFNSSGLLVVASGDCSVCSEARAVYIQADGRLLLAGASSEVPSRFVALRLTASGGVDSSFGSGGAAAATVGIGFATAFAVTQQVDGRIVLAGTCVDGTTGNDFCVLRLKADGSLDLSLGGTGQHVTAVTTGADNVRAALIQPDGKLLLGGYCSLEGATFCAVRFGLSCTMDVDGDGSVLSTSDALILTRVSLGMTGNAVINGINFPAAATRRTWTAIRDHLANTCGMALAP